jgi:hypothetical protein
MELLLNLAWLLLALPAYWLWRGRGIVRLGRRSSLQCLLSLACMLVILFPVVSATDDLHVMRAEMEESPTSKRSVCQRSAEKASACQHQPALASLVPVLYVENEEWRAPSLASVRIAPFPSPAPAGRSPPASPLA